MPRGTRGDLLSSLSALVGATRPSHPPRIAVDGPPASGKTTLADELAAVLLLRGRDVIRASIDDFLFPRARRYRRGEYSAAGCYFDTHDYDALNRVLLDPLGPGGDGRFRRAAYDRTTDTSILPQVTTARDDAVLIFDGVFLLRPELIDRWDLRIFVSTEFERTVSRALIRERHSLSAADVDRRWRERYIPAQQLYFATVRPTDYADVVVHNEQQSRLDFVVHLSYYYLMPSIPMTTDDVRRFFDALGTMAPATDDVERIDRVRLFEELKSRLEAVQAEHAVEFAASQRAEQAAAGVPADRRDRGIGSQLGLARRTSPWAATRWLGFARIATTELPGTFMELKAGRTTLWRVMLVARETAVLSRSDRATVDAQLAPRLVQLGDRQVEIQAKTAAQRLDPAAAAKRARRAESERRVSIRPAPDTMCWLSALLPMVEGVAAYASLRRTADGVIGTGADRDRPDGPRSRDQVMADTLVERVTGQATAEAVPVEINLIMTDRTLLDEDDEPAVIPGFGPVPAGVARDLAHGSRGQGAPRWLRRLSVHPDTGQLVTMDTARRLFTKSQRKFLELRDQTCRTPYCGAPVRHADHIAPSIDGGRTALDNGQAYCAACNHAKHAPGWRTHTRGEVIYVITPTRHSYTSHAPDPPARPLIEVHIDAWHHAA